MPPRPTIDRSLALESRLGQFSPFLVSRVLRRSGEHLANSLSACNYREFGRKSARCYLLRRTSLNMCGLSDRQIVEVAGTSPTTTPAGAPHTLNLTGIGSDAGNCRQPLMSSR